MALARGGLATLSNGGERVDEALNGSPGLRLVEKRRVDREACHARLNELAYLRRQVEGHRVIDARTAIEIRSDGQETAVSIAKRDHAPA